jgi:hypothetical protein
LTRYTALYSSLSTSYDVRFASPSALALPFALDQQVLAGQTSGVTFTTLGVRTLAGYRVASNSTGMVHSEEMFDLGGDILLTGEAASPTVQNRTSLKLSRAVVIRRRTDAGGRSIDETAWLGNVDSGGTAAVQFREHDRRESNEWLARAPVTAKDPPEGALSVRRLIDCAADHASLEPGEVRLVAWHDGRLAGMEITPAASQARRAAVLVAHLKYSWPTEPRPDYNLPAPTRSPDELF